MELLQRLLDFKSYLSSLHSASAKRLVTITIIVTNTNIKTSTTFVTIFSYQRYEKKRLQNYYISYIWSFVRPVVPKHTKIWTRHLPRKKTAIQTNWYKTIIEQINGQITFIYTLKSILQPSQQIYSRIFRSALNSCATF